jgi:hypothetical protein
MKKGFNIWGIRYNWHVHHAVGEVYHHYYVGVEYEAPDWEHKAIVTFIRPVDDYYLVSFDNGVDIKVNNINQIMLTPDDFSETKSG